MLKCIRFYQKYLSCMKGYSTCIYYPTCSQYAIEAIEKYGAIKRRGPLCGPGESSGAIHLQKADTTPSLKKCDNNIRRKLKNDV